MKKIYTFAITMLALLGFSTTANAITVEDLQGSYTETSSGYDYYIWSWYWGTSDYTFNLTPDDEYAGNVYITSIDDTTIGLSYLYWSEETLIGTVDFDAKTITFAAGQTWQEWATFPAIKMRMVQ